MFYFTFIYVLTNYACFNIFVFDKLTYLNNKSTNRALVGIGSKQKFSNVPEVRSNLKKI